MKFILTLLFIPLAALASPCNFSIDREACPGKEQEAHQPYGGQNPTSSMSMVETEAACLSDARALTKSIRRGIIKKITVTASFAGSTLNPVSNQMRCSNR